MKLIYKISSVGWDKPLEELSVLVPQPHSVGPQPTRRTYAANGEVFDELEFIELIYDTVPNGTVYDAILAQFGLGLVSPTKKVTALIPNRIYGAQLVNAIAVMPEIGKDVTRERFFIRNMTILLKQIQPAA